MDCLPHILAIALHSQGGFNTAVPGLGLFCRADAYIAGAGAYANSGSGNAFIGCQDNNGTRFVVGGSGSVFTASYIEGAEQSAPAAPAANGYRIFAQDNGAGKTQLMVIFASGAAQQIAIEP